MPRIAETLSKEDFQSPYTVAVLYPKGCAGKFIINALGLSSGALFQDRLLAQRQLNNAFSSRDKIEYLLTRLAMHDANTLWNDLDLGCIQLFGLDQFDINCNSGANINIIKESIVKRKYIFIVAHNRLEEQKILSRWNNARIIKLYNCNHMQQLQQRNNYATQFLLDRYPKSHLKWNAKFFDSEESVLTHINDMYIQLGLNDFNKDYILEYYRSWHDVCKLQGRL